jgi:hypothetical protein
MKTINIAMDFGPEPAGRFPEDGPYNGQKFRDEILAPALMKNDNVIVILDGVSGFGSSFLEESFGGLIRKRIFDKATLLKKLEIKWKDPELEFYAELINEFINDAVPE